MRQLLTDLRGNPIYSFAQRRLRRIRHYNPSTLICLIQNRSWEEVVRRARKHPSEILHRDEVTGNTPLHIACRLDPPPAVLLALRAASRIQNLEGATPLHIAASHRCSAQSMKVLIECARQHKNSDRKNVSPTADLSRMGRAPIHYACMSFRGLEIDAFRLLFEESIKEGNLVLGPEKLFDLGDEFDDDEEELLDDIYSIGEPSTQMEVNVLGMKDATGQTPLALLFRRYRERVKVVIARVDRLHREHKDMPEKAALAAAMTVHAELGDLWKRAGWIIARLTEERLKREGNCNRDLGKQCCRSPGELAVAKEAASWATECIASANPKPSLFGKSIRASFPSLANEIENGSGGQFRRLQFRIVHASVGLTGYGCPPEIIRLALSLHPHQVREMDEEGNLPIHIAATASSFLARPDNTQPNFMAAAAAMAVPVDASADDLSVISEAMSFFSSATVSQTTNAFDKVIKLLLERFPEGASTPHGKNGKLPLVLALKTGVRTWEDGLRSLMNAYPPALHSEKIIPPAVYPHVLALLANERTTILDSSHDVVSHHVPSSKILRREAGARTTLFELLRAKPDLITIKND